MTTYISAVSPEQVEAILAANAARMSGFTKHIVMMTEDGTETPGDYITVHGIVRWTTGRSFP